MDHSRRHVLEVDVHWLKSQGIYTEALRRHGTYIYSDMIANLDRDLLSTVANRPNESKPLTLAAQAEIDYRDGGELVPSGD